MIRPDEDLVDEDRLAAARGILIGCGLGVVLWSPVIYLAWWVTHK